MVSLAARAGWSEETLTSVFCQTKEFVRAGCEDRLRSEPEEWDLVPGSSQPLTGIVTFCVEWEEKEDFMFQ